MALTVIGMDHCGNSPRMISVGELITAWAGQDTDAVSTALADDVVHEDVQGVRHTGREAVLRSFCSGDARRLVIRSLCTHGRLAAADGTLTGRNGDEIAFSHHLTFSGASKTARVTEIRSYSRTATS